MYKLRIQAIMDERQLSLADMSRLCPTVDKSTLWRVLHCHRDPRLSTIVALAQGLGVGIGYLVQMD
jgi:transcriptional regulator with XRE-family HTH domain